MPQVEPTGDSFWTELDENVSVFTSRLGLLLGSVHCGLSLLVLHWGAFGKVGLASADSLAVEWRQTDGAQVAPIVRTLLCLLLHPTVMIHKRLIRQESRLS
jgi:hypothetical protein